MADEMAKTADDRLARAAALQLRKHGVASVAVVGRAISALADDPGLLTLTGRALRVDELAARYGIDVTT